MTIVSSFSQQHNTRRRERENKKKKERLHILWSVTRKMGKQIVIFYFDILYV